MLLKLAHSQLPIHKELQVTGSKSETNRLLILQALFNQIQIENKSNSDDSNALQEALQKKSAFVDIHHAGTAMRFLTAYFAIQEGSEVSLTGSSRMQERPIKILVEALQSLGAEINYLNNEGFPPLHIKGKRLEKNTVVMNANVSSQYISALMLIGAALPNGLTITLEGTITSVPYIEMTLQLLRKIGISAHFEKKTIKIAPLVQVAPISLTVESDWSSASYFYSIVALSRDAQISLRTYTKNSLQGDRVLQDIYTNFGVQSKLDNGVLTLTKAKGTILPKELTLDLANAPDIAQTIAVTCLGLGIGCHLTGLHTLKIKETDRLEALREEITKLAGGIMVSDDTLTLLPQKAPIRQNITIETYKDHRMAMAFAPLALKTPILINEALVVTKSFPDFWNDLSALGFETTEII